MPFRLLIAALVAMLAAVSPAWAQQPQPGLLESLGKLLAPTGGASESATPPTRSPTLATARGETRTLAVAPTAKRIALVIGNDAYRRVSKLEKAGNDATAMARELKAAGFEVLLHRDLDYRAMVKAVETLANSITGGDQVVVFFAGHGVQIKTGSYLLPVDIEAGSESEVEKTAYGLADLTDKLQEAKASFALVLVDACRDNPLRTKGRSIGATRGLSAIEPPKGQMVIYSASKGQQALDRLSDNDPHPNGVFTREFIARMKRPNQRIEELVREVQDAVEELARGVSHDQRPAIYNEARGNFYFFGNGTQVAGLGAQIVGGRSKEQIEDELWDAIKGSDKPSVFEAYLREYPNGRYLAQARVKLAALKDAKPAAEPPKFAVSPAPSFSAPARGDDPEADFWSEVKASGAREYHEAYLKQYPKGKYVALAKLELKKLDDKEKAEKAKEEAERKTAAAREQQEARQAEQDAWERAKTSGTAAAYAGYLGSYPKGRYVALAQAARQKAQRDEADREKQETARREREARDAEHRRIAAEKEAAERAKLEAERLAKEAAEMRPGKAFKDCADCPEMVMIQAGSFEMGANNGDSDEKPVHSVRIGRPFAIGKTEVTQGQWRAVMGSNPSHFSSCGDDCPVEKVSWGDAQEFVRKLSQRTGKTYRLPSEAEWEYACRAGGAHPYCGGGSIDTVAWYGASATPVGNSAKTTNPVARKQANAWGLHDMSGNVGEWVEDCRNDSYNGAPNDGSAWTRGECGQRVLRGGSWYSKPQNARAASRNWDAATIRGDIAGFRPVRMLP